MSVIGKKPFVNKIIDLCTKEQVTQVINYMNHLGEPTLVALYGDDNIISSTNLGVSYATFKMNEILALIPTGILVYIDNANCGFFVINANSNSVTEYNIDPVERKYIIVNENLTVEELRQVCGDRLVEVGGNITVQADDIDSGSATEGQTLVALGGSAENYIPYSISFDGTGNDYQRTLQMHDAGKIFFRNENVSTSKSTFESYTQGHFLSEYIQNNTLELTESSGQYISTKAFNGSEIKGVHITLKLITSADTASVGLDVLPFDEDEGESVRAYGICGSDLSVVMAEMNGNGIIVITLPNGVTLASATYYLR